MPLFNDELHPISSTIAFIENDINTITSELIAWQNPLINKFNNTLQSKVINEDLKKTMLSLCPLTTIEKRRYLLIPTKSKWTAFFDNGHMGTDRTAPEVLGEKLNSKVIYISFDTIEEENVFDYYDLIDGDYGLKRAISVTKESKWEFNQYGNALSFEDIEKYKLRTIKERFTIDMLNNYLKEFSIDIFNEDFYNTLDGSMLINKIGPKFKDTRELSLQDTKEFFK